MEETEYKQNNKETTEKKKPCRVCSEFKTYRKQKSKQEKQQNIHSDQPDSHQDNNVSSSLIVPNYEPFPCPPDSEELGKSTWTFLHTMAAYYPSHPDSQTQTQMNRFLGDFSKFYPCGYCASHLQTYIQSHPPQVHSNSSLSQWLCHVHNEVNERLGKPKFDCSKVFERWLNGSPGSDCS